MSELNNALDAVALETDARQGEFVIKRIYDFIGRFVVFPTDHARVAVTLWVLHAHLIDRWDSTPRLAFLSAEPGSGKTRALEILELLVPRAVSAVNVSPAYLFRRVASEQGKPTVLFDEIDTVFGPKAKENEEVRAFLNAGHRKGAVAGRCVVHGKTVLTEELESYCAVALAGLGWLPATILNRSVIIRMRRRHGGEHVQPFRRRQHKPEGDRIYDQIIAWVQSQPAEIAAWPEMPAEIEDRDADVWEALLAIADMVGGAWPVRARKAAVALVAASQENEPSLGVRLLTDIQQIFDADMLPSKSILQKLQEIQESPWGDIKGKPLDERGLAHRLRQYGIKSKTVRVGTATPKGYARADFYDAWARYLAPAKSATGATAATSAQDQGLDVADDVAPVAEETSLNRPKNSNGHAVVASVAPVADLPEGTRKCAQCNSTNGPLARFGAVYLHKECRRFWRDMQ